MALWEIGGDIKISGTDVATCTTTACPDCDPCPETYHMDMTIAWTDTSVVSVRFGGKTFANGSTKSICSYSTASSSNNTLTCVPGSCAPTPGTGTYFFGSGATTRSFSAVSTGSSANKVFLRSKRGNTVRPLLPNTCCLCCGCNAATGEDTWSLSAFSAKIKRKRKWRAITSAINTTCTGTSNTATTVSSSGVASTSGLGWVTSDPQDSVLHPNSKHWGTVTTSNGYTLTWSRV